MAARRADGGVVDFVSVGSNVTCSRSAAADRGNTQLADRFDLLSVPFLRVCSPSRSLLMPVANHTPPPVVNSPGKPIRRWHCLAFGYRSISMPSPASIGPVGWAMLTELPFPASWKSFLDDNLSRSCQPADARVAVPASLRTTPHTYDQPAHDRMNQVVAARDMLEVQMAAGPAPATSTSSWRPNIPATSRPLLPGSATYAGAEQELADLEAMLSDMGTDAVGDACLPRWTSPEVVRTASRQAARNPDPASPKDAKDEPNAILEIRAGTGGDEAVLPAGATSASHVRALRRSGKAGASRQPPPVWRCRAWAGKPRHRFRRCSTH